MRSNPTRPTEPEAQGKGAELEADRAPEAGGRERRNGETPPLMKYPFRWDVSPPTGGRTTTGG